MYPETVQKINEELEGKEFILQHTKRGYRCISWHPHYIMTPWKKDRKESIKDGDRTVKEYYENT